MPRVRASASSGTAWRASSRIPSASRTSSCSRHRARDVTLPPGTTYVSSDGSPSVNGNVVTFNEGAINGGAGWNAGAGFRVTVKMPSSTGQIAVSATATPAEPEANAADNSATATTTVQ